MDDFPERLCLCKGDEVDRVFASVTKVFFVGDKDFVHHLAVKMNYPSWIQDGLGIVQTVGRLQVKIKNKLEWFPLCLDISVYRRPQDDEIVAVVMGCSMIQHYDMMREKARKLFTKGITFHSMGSFISEKFELWANEDVDNRASRIKSILRT